MNLQRFLCLVKKKGTDICFDWVDDTAAFQSSLAIPVSPSLSYCTRFFWFGGCFITQVHHHFTATCRRLPSSTSKTPFSTSLSYGSAVLVLPFYVSSYNLPTYIPCGNIKCSNIHLYTLCLGPVATVLHSHIHDTENLACTKQLLRRQEPHDAADHIYPTSFQYNPTWRLHLTYCGSAVLHVPD